MASGLDLLLINPNGRDRIYQELGEELTAVEPPLWCSLIGGYVVIAAIRRNHRCRGGRLGSRNRRRKVARRAPLLVDDRVRPPAVGIDATDGGGEPDLPRRSRARMPTRGSSSSGDMSPPFPNGRCGRKRSILPATAKDRSRSMSSWRSLRQDRAERLSPKSRGWCGAKGRRFARTRRPRSSRISTRTCTAMSWDLLPMEQIPRAQLAMLRRSARRGSPMRRSIRRSDVLTSARSAASMRRSAPTDTGCAARRRWSPRSIISAQHLRREDVSRSSTRCSC